MLTVFGVLSAADDRNNKNRGFSGLFRSLTMNEAPGGAWTRRWEPTGAAGTLGSAVFPFIGSLLTPSERATRSEGFSLPGAPAPIQAIRLPPAGAGEVTYRTTL